MSRFGAVVGDGTEYCPIFGVDRGAIPPAPTPDTTAVPPAPGRGTLAAEETTGAAAWPAPPAVAAMARDGRGLRAFATLGAPAAGAVE